VIRDTFPVYGSKGGLRTPHRRDGLRNLTENVEHEYNRSDRCTRAGNKVRELVTVRLPWQQWTETSVWFDDVDISEFHSCFVVVVVVVVVDLSQSLSE
jgi:hypothetical protein